MQHRNRIKWIAALLAILPASAVALVGPRAWLEAHALLAILLIISYEIALLFLSFTSRIWTRLQEIWADRIADKLDERIARRLAGYRSNYLQYLHELHFDDDLTGIPIRAPFSLPLAHVYVDLSLVSRPIHRLSKDIISLKDHWPLTDTQSPDIASRRDSIWHYLPDRRRQVLAIVGVPGGGKTTLLRHVTLTMAESRKIVNGKPAHTKQLPLLLYLREHAQLLSANPDLPLSELVSRSLSHMRRAPTANWFETHLKSGNCLIMLDGLDEVALLNARRLLVQWTERQIANYPRCSFIITSRPHGYQETPLNAATVLQVRALSQRQIEQFVHQWSMAAAQKNCGRHSDVVRHQAQQKADDLLNRMRGSDAIQDLAANPLLLTMIVHLHNFHDSLPGSRVQLYREICQVLLGKRQEAKGLGAGSLTADQRELVLRHLALKMMKMRKRDISQADAEMLIAEPLARANPSLPARDYLSEIQQGSGIIVEREHGMLAFVHETLQEYLTATRLHEQRDLEVLKENVNDIWWRETILLYCAQSNASPIVRACLISKTASALALATECVEIALEIDPVVRQAVDTALSGKQVSQDASAQRVITASLFARKLRRVIRLDQGTHLISAPVTWSEYLSFVADRRRNGHGATETEWRGLRSLAGVTGVATGIAASDAAEFASWVTELVSDGRSYRLPKPEELADRTAGRALDLRERGYWVVTENRKFGGKVFINPEANDIVLDGAKALESFLARLNWRAVQSAIRNLSSSTRAYLRWQWLDPHSVEASDRDAEADELLKLLTFMSCLDKALLPAVMQYFRRCFLEYHDVIEVLTLAESLDCPELYSLTTRQRSELLLRNSAGATLNRRSALIGCLAFQLRLDVRLVGWDAIIAPLDRVGDPGIDRELVPCARNADVYGLPAAVKAMKAHVDIKRLVDQAEHGRLLLHRDAVRAGIPRLDRQSICRFASLADSVASQIASAMYDERYMQPSVGAKLRLSAAICSEFASYAGRDLRSGRGGAPWPNRFIEIYSSILADLFVLDWQIKGFVEPIESVLLVRE